MTSSRTCWLLAVLLGCCCRCLAQEVPTTKEEFIGPRFTDQPKDVIIDDIAEQDNHVPQVRLPCAAKGEKPITYRWLKNLQALDLNSRQSPYKMDAGALVIKNPEKSRDEGNYQCVAMNKHGRVVSNPTALRSAYVNPFASTPRPPVSGRQGEGAVLRCQKPEAYPGLIFFWVESGTLNPAFRGTDQRVYVSRKTGDLYFARTEASDPGEYQCVIRLTLEGSQLRELSPSNSFSLSGQASSQSAASLVLYEGAATLAVARTTVVMEAFAYGNPIPTLTWRRLDAQGNEVDMPPSSRLTMETFKRALTITDVRSEDAGFYEVTASNSLRSQTRRTQLIVHDIPNFSIDQSIFRQNIGESVTFVVGLGRSDLGTVTWLHNSVILTEGGRYTMTRSGQTASLQIINLVEEDSGIYQCSTRETHGIFYGGGSVLYSGAPSYLENFRRTESGDSYAIIGWDLPDGSSTNDIGRYQFFVTPTGGGNTRIINVPPGETSTRVDFFSNHSSNYIIRGRANSKKLDIPGPLTNEETGGRAPDPPPDPHPVPLLAWLLPLLLLLLLFLLCCCCCLWLGLCGKYCPCCTCWTCFGPGTTKTPTPPAVGMDKHHKEMLKLYQPDVVKHVKRPDRVTMYLASINVLKARVIKVINNQHTQDGYNRKIVDSLILYGGNEAFQGYCSSLRKEEKLYWLADTLEGPGLSVYRRELLMRHQSILVERMDHDITLAYLSKKGVFTSAMTEYVSSATSCEEKNRRILHLLQSRSDDEFSVFLDALRQNECQPDLVDLFIPPDQKPAEQTLKPTWNGGGQQQKQTWHVDGQQQKQTWNVDGQQQKQTWNGGQISGSGVYINKQTEKVTAKRGLYFTDPSIKSGASAMVQIGQPVILEVNGEVANAQWMLNGRPLPQHKGIHVRTYGLTHELKIDAMIPDLAGTYTCQGTTPDGAMLSCDINITSMEPKMVM